MRPLSYLLAGLAVVTLSGPLGSVAWAAADTIRVAAGPPPHDQNAKSVDQKPDDEKELTPEQKFRKRFPQPAQVGHLIGLPVLDDDDSTIGYVRQVVRGSDGKISLIVPYSPWFGWLPVEWSKRPVAVPIEAVTILARQLDSVDMQRSDYDDAPTWQPSKAQPLSPDEKILVALGRR